MIESLHSYQNPDGGWPYRVGASSWTEPTVLSLLAGYANSDDTGRKQGLTWLRNMQRLDGGWSPKAGVEQSTWVTALAALIPVDDLGEAAHTRAIRWLLGTVPANTTWYVRLQSWLNGVQLGESSQGWPWLPGTTAWATPTAIAILALDKQNRRNPDAVLQARVKSARSFLLTHRCVDGGWNHGAIKALGVDAPSYPETTGTGLLAMANLETATVAPSIKCAEKWWSDCPSSEAASWLMLGLRAAGRAKDAPPAALKPRTVQDAALQAIAAAGDNGLKVFVG